MIARICDRCGAAYAPDQGKEYKKGGQKYNMIKFGSCSHGNSITNDLCPQCMEQLIDWMKNYYVKEKENK